MKLNKLSMITVGVLWMVLGFGCDNDSLLTSGFVLWGIGISINN